MREAQRDKNQLSECQQTTEIGAEERENGGKGSISAD
jgi:hypothetical protein